MSGGERVKAESGRRASDSEWAIHGGGLGRDKGGVVIREGRREKGS